MDLISSLKKHFILSSDSRSKRERLLVETSLVSFREVLRVFDVLVGVDIMENIMVIED